MIWEEQLTSCSEMFSSLYDVTEIDLSNFDSSKVRETSNMFANCGSLTSINFRNFKTELVTEMSEMFSNCGSLSSLDLSSFVTSKVKEMSSMFESCDSLTSLDLSNFDTSEVLDMSDMFNDCTSLSYLNLDNFNTSKVNKMDQMFSNCNSLTSLNLNSFNTKLIKDMSDLFKDCSSLEILHLDNFDTSSVVNMNSMFFGCNSLISLNLASFDASNTKDTSTMFKDCSSLEFLDLSNFETTSLTNMYAMFSGCESLISLDISNFDISSVANMENLFYDCVSLISLDLRKFNNLNGKTTTGMFSECDSDLKICTNGNLNNLPSNNFKYFNCTDDCFTNSINKFITEKTKCIDNCWNDNDYKYEYGSKCYESCPNGTHISQYNIYICEKDLKCDHYYNLNLTECFDYIPLGYYLYNSNENILDKCNIKCLNCTLESNILDLCVSCNITGNYFPKYNSSMNPFIDCYNEDIENHYLDMNNNILMPCYSKCKKCHWHGNESENNCTECYENYTLNNGNCIQENHNNIEILSSLPSPIEYNYYLNNSNNSNITEDMRYHISEIINSYNYSSKSDISQDIQYYFSEIINSYNNSNKYSFPSDIQYHISEIINSYNKSNHIFNYYEMLLHENVSEKNYSNFTFIKLSPASKNIIMSNFNLDLTKDKIYILIIEDQVNDENSAVRKIDFKFILENGTILNLDIITEDIYADIFFPLIDENLAKYNFSLYFLEQGYDIYDKNGSFYNDICSSAYLDNNEITLSDRKKDIYPNNVMLCPNNCQYKAFNSEEKIINCDCNLNTNKNYTNKTDDFLKEDNGNFFSYFLDYINYGILKCYNLIITYDNLSKNYAFYSSFIISSISIVITIYFWSYGISKIRKIMINEAPNYH